MAPPLHEQVPGFFVLFVFGARIVWRQEDVWLVVCGLDWEDVPGVGGDYIGGYEVDLGCRVCMAVGVEVAFVGASAAEVGALDLDAEEASVGFDGEVVGSVVSPGLGDTESLLGGARHKT